LIISKEEALKMFEFNPFKLQFIKSKIPDGGKTVVYRCGSLIDLCTGPHVIDSGKIAVLSIEKCSSAYWLSNKDNDSL